LAQNVVQEEIARRRASSPASVLPTVPTGETVPGQAVPAAPPTTTDTTK